MPEVMRRPGAGVPRAVICLETGESWRSLFAASCSAGIDKSLFKKMLDAGQTIGGKNYRYADDYRKDLEDTNQCR